MLAERDLRHLYLSEHLSDASVYISAERVAAHSEALRRCEFMAKRLRADPFLRCVELPETSPMTLRLVLALLYRVPLPGFVSADTAEAFARETAAYAPELLSLPDAEVIRDALVARRAAPTSPVESSVEAGEVAGLVKRSKALEVAGVEPAIAKSDSPDRALLLWPLEFEAETVSAS
jgi:hypothetical protein